MQRSSRPPFLGQLGRESNPAGRGGPGAPSGAGANRRPGTAAVAPVRGGGHQLPNPQPNLQQIDQLGQHRGRIGALELNHQGRQGRPSRRAAAGQRLPQQRPPGQIPHGARQGLLGTEHIHEAIAEGHAVVEARATGLQPAGQC